MAHGCVFQQDNEKKGSEYLLYANIVQIHVKLGGGVLVYRESEAMSDRKAQHLQACKDTLQFPRDLTPVILVCGRCHGACAEGHRKWWMLKKEVYMVRIYII